MNKYILIDEQAMPSSRILAAAAWLESLGGGTIVAETKQSMMDSFEVRSDGDFKKLERSLSSRSVLLTWRRRGLPRSGNVVAAFATKQTIDELDHRKKIDRLLVLGWASTDYAEWKSLNNPTEMKLEQPKPTGR